MRLEAMAELSELLYQLCSVTGPKTLQEMEIEMEMEMKRKMKEKESPAPPPTEFSPILTKQFLVAMEFPNF